MIFTDEYPTVGMLYTGVTNLSCRVSVLSFVRLHICRDTLQLVRASCKRNPRSRPPCREPSMTIDPGGRMAGFRTSALVMCGTGKILIHVNV